MSELNGTTWVTGTTGPQHNGNGDINVTVLADQQAMGRPSFTRFADDQLAWLRRVLVAPPGMGNARSQLADTGTVILDGEPGSGRSCAARVLLREHHKDMGTFRELLPDEAGELPLADPELVGAGDRLLLDLSAADTVRWAACRADLSALRKAVHEERAHLVVVMPHGGTLESDLQQYRVEILQPRREWVLRRHLRTHGLPPEQYLRPDPTVTEFLYERRPLREVADFADLVRRAREAAASGDEFTQWCATARKAQADRREEVAALVARLGDSSQRALLISVAMLHGAHADVVHRAAQLLLHTVGSPPDDLPLLQRKDLAERLAEISAGAGPDGRVWFRDLDYDSAVRTHFWDHMPDLRQHLGAWTARSVALNSPHVTQELRDGLVAKLAGEYLRTGRAEGLASLAEDWGSTATSRAGLEAAVQALTCGLGDPEHAGALRGWIYQSCANKHLKGEYARVLVQVCADVIAAGHPDQAMLRLYYLARREHGTAGALQALSDLVESSHRLRRRLLHRLARSEPSQADLGIFLRVGVAEALTDPYDNGRALAEERRVRSSVITCWSAVLNRLPRPTWQPYAERWLHTSVDAGTRGDMLLDLLVGAADRCEGRRGAAFAALYASARDAERTAPGGSLRAALTTDLLLQKICSAQGLSRPITPPQAASPRGTAR
ncbi:hypothetical protein OG782_04030 [Streptomyces sp. NBC_00876]|uniref:hypothetical protein n=1 Tax=Streptomyces sp. NBC_00876 TaxID=2975853 RepID=UPI003870D4F1|nr:hypothetical protein OG782_04030 [Streptomyces sp. NBC_00876]